MSLQYVIDGYNITNHPAFTRIHKKSQESCFALLDLIKDKKLCGSRNNKAVLVFDGYPPQRQVNVCDQQVSMIFSKEITADERIKKIVIAAKDKKNLIVVSDDKEVFYFAKVSRARALRAGEFLEKISQEEKRAQVLRAHPESGEGLSYSQKSKINEELKKLWLK